MNNLGNSVSSDHAASSREVSLTIDGHSVQVSAGTTILNAARELDIDIPTLCDSPRLNPVGSCRICLVEVGEKLPVPACLRVCETGMEIQTDTPALQRSRSVLLELLMTEQQFRNQTASSSTHLSSKEAFKTNGECELKRLHEQLHTPALHSPAVSRFPMISQTEYSSDTSQDRQENWIDDSSPGIAVDHAVCILCDCCIRACDDLQSNHVISRSGKGSETRIAFDLNVPMGNSSCVTCGECVAVCPTEALMQKPVTLSLRESEPITLIDSLCPYCGVGCAVSVYVNQTENQIVAIEGRNSPVNEARLCVKGRYGWDYAHHPQRLIKPLIRRESAYPKGPISAEVSNSVSQDGSVRQRMIEPALMEKHFREASWDEALDLIGKQFRSLKRDYSEHALAGFGSAKCSNEEAYLFQKLIRAGFGTNNVDHCTRLCHASSVAALMETIGSGAVTNVFQDVRHADLILVTGSNTTANHPVAATFIKQAVKQGAKLIVVDVHQHPLVQFASHFAQIRPGSDVAFYNAVMHVLIKEDLIDHQFIASRTENFVAIREQLLQESSPAQMSPLCGIAENEIVQITRTIGNAKRMLTFWGMGIAQHAHGTDNARCLISLCLLTGNIGRPGTGLHPLRGQNNVQGASDAGLIPIVYPDYQSVTDTEVQLKFEQAWKRKLDANVGLTVVEIMNAALKKQIRGMYILGENPLMSDPNINKVRNALSSLDFLVVQDIFPTETTEFADVILPASSYWEKTGTFTNTDRRVQLGHKVLSPPGEVREDWEIICEIGKQIGLPMEYESVAEVFDEFVSLTENYRGMSHANLGQFGKLWPCDDPNNETDQGTAILFGTQFPTKSGKGRFVPAHYLPPAEPINEEYPFILGTGRLLEHWHTGSMTRRTKILHYLEPEPFARMHPADLEQLNIADQSLIEVSSRRGKIRLIVRSDSHQQPGSIFIPFHFREAAANMLTNDVLDPFGKIPEFKHCAVRIDPATD